MSAIKFSNAEDSHSHPTEVTDAQKRKPRPKSANVTAIDRSYRLEAEIEQPKRFTYVDLEGPTAIYSKREDNPKKKAATNRALQFQSREELYDKTISLKKQLNEAFNDRKLLKAKVVRLEEVVTKRDKQYEDLLGVISTSNNGGELARTFKSEESQVSSLKKYIKELERTIKTHSGEITHLKNDIRYTRVNELERENKTYHQEIIHLQRMIDNELTLIEGSESFQKLKLNIAEAEQNLRDAKLKINALEDLNQENNKRIQELDSHLIQTQKDHDEYVNAFSLSRQEEELNLKSIIREKESKIAVLTETKQQSDLKCSDLQIQLDESLERKHELQSRLNELQSKKTDLENEKNQISEKALAMEAKMDEQSLKIVILKKEMKGYQDGEKQLRGQLKEMENLRDQLRESEMNLIKQRNQLLIQIETLKQDGESAVHEIELEKQKVTRDLEARLAASERSADLIFQEKATALAKNATLSEEVTSLKQQVNSLQAENTEKHNRMEKENDLHQRIVNELQHSISALQSENDELLQSKTSEHQRIVNDLQNSIATLQSENDELKSLVSNTKALEDCDQASVHTFIVNDKASKNSSMIQLMTSKASTQEEEKPSSHSGSKVQIFDGPKSTSAHGSKTQLASSKTGSVSQLKTGSKSGLAEKSYKTGSAASLTKSQSVSAGNLSRVPKASSSKTQVNSAIPKTSSRTDVLIEPTEI